MGVVPLEWEINTSEDVSSSNMNLSRIPFSHYNEIRKKTFLRMYGERERVENIQLCESSLTILERPESVAAPDRGNLWQAISKANAICKPITPNVDSDISATESHHCKAITGPVTPSANSPITNEVNNQANEDESEAEATGLTPHFAEFCILERQAKFHRRAAVWCDATCTWSGVLPKRTNIADAIGFSTKVFLGGIPWDSTEQVLISTLKRFGNISIEWPGKSNDVKPRGHAYAIFENQNQVKLLLSMCVFETNDDGDCKWFYDFPANRSKPKPVQIIPWILNDINYISHKLHSVDPNKTVFVGALHGTLNANGLAKIMDDLFDGVVHAGIDTDKWKYPIGSGRVTFSNEYSYAKAVKAALVHIKTDKVCKKIQIDPYLEDSFCSHCRISHGIYFCRNSACFRYFCCACWQIVHGDIENHNPLTKHTKSFYQDSCF